MKKIDKSILFIPTFCIVLFTIIFSIFSSHFKSIITNCKNFIVSNFSSYYLIFGIMIVLILFYIAFSNIGKIKIGKEKTKMKESKWFSLIFTSTMAADILFFSFHEWSLYSKDLNVSKTTSLQYSLFHWGITPWSFYIILAIIYGYFYWNKKIKLQKISQACSPIIKKKYVLKFINIFSVLVLLFGTTTTFSITTPLISQLVSNVFDIKNSVLLNIIILLTIFVLFTSAVFIKNGIEVIAKYASLTFVGLLVLFLIFGNTKFILENGLKNLGLMFSNTIQNNFGLNNNLAINYTSFYWSYWIVWTIATPFYIGKISYGRTIKEIILKGLLAGVGGTFLSFIIFGGAFISFSNEILEPIQLIILTLKKIFINYTAISIFIVISMVLLYTSTFDIITETMCEFSKNDENVKTNKFLKIYWSLTFLILPILLIIFKSSTELLLSLSIIMALPFSLIIVLIILSFFKEIKKDKDLMEKIDYEKIT